MTLVVDASTVVAALVDAGPDGRWARGLVASDSLASPHLLPVETASLLRRLVLRGQLSQVEAGAAHSDLVALAVAMFPYGPLADRVWQLRENVTLYDAWYVAVAEALDCPLVTLDRRLARASGPRCGFVTPPPGP